MSFNALKDPKWVEIDFVARAGNTSLEIPTFIDIFVAYWRLTYSIWVLLICGWFFVGVSICAGFEPDSSGAVLVALGAVSESVLLWSRWQSYPSKIGFGYVRIWRGKDDGVKHFTKEGVDGNNEELIVLGGDSKKSILQLLILSKKKHSRHFAFSGNALFQRKVVEKRSSGLFWDISETTRHVSFIINIYITGTVIFGTLIWGYYYYISPNVDSLICI